MCDLVVGWAAGIQQPEDFQGSQQEDEEQHRSQRRLFWPIQMEEGIGNWWARL